MVKFFVTGEDNRLSLIPDFKDLCWVDMVNPTDDEVDDVVEATGVSEDMIKAALDEEEPARTEFDDGNSMFVVDCPIIEETDSGDTYSTLPLAIIYNKKCIITVCLKGNPVLKDFITGRIKVFCDKPAGFILNFMYGNAKRFLYCLKQIDRKARRVQAELGRTLKNDEILQLLDLENSLVYFSTSLNSNYKVHEKLSKVEAVATREDYRDLFDDMVIESSQAIMIAGFWGMNVAVPWQMQNGDASTVWFWVIIAVTFLLTAGVAFILVKSMNTRPARRRQKKHRRKRSD